MPSVDRLLRTAQAQMRRGEFCEAGQIYKTILTTYPGNRRASEGLAALEQAQAAAPPAPPALIARLQDHLRAGAPRTAADEAARALTTHPGAPELIDLRALALSKLGDHDGAVALWRALISCYPKQANLQGRLGNALLAAGDAEGAAEAFGRMIALRPGDAVAHNNLGNAMNALLRPDAALAAFRDAVAADPNLLPARVNLGRLLFLRGEAEAAQVHLEAAVALAPRAPTLLSELGTVIAARGDAATALAWFDAALALDPDLASAHLGRAALHRFTADEPALSRLVAGLADPARARTDRAACGFALGKARDDLGDVPGAFEAFARANALRKSALGYDIAQDRALFAQIRESFTQPAAPLAPGLAQGPQPIFILGLPRSGTTLVEQILSAHPQIVAGGEREEFNARLRELDWADPGALAREGASLARSYRQMLAQVGGEARFVTDKMPLNFRWIGAIRMLFPKAPILHLRRDPRATLWSIYRTSFAGSGYGWGYDLDDLVAYHGLYTDLTAHWHALFPRAILDLDYEALTEDPEVRIRALIAGLGLPWDAACLRPQDNARAVNTASSQQVRQPIYTGSSQGWRRYEASLGGAFDALI